MPVPASQKDTRMTTTHNHLAGAALIATLGLAGFAQGVIAFLRDWLKKPGK